MTIYSVISAQNKQNNLNRLNLNKHKIALTLCPGIINNRNNLLTVDSTSWIATTITNNQISNNLKIKMALTLCPGIINNKINLNSRSRMLSISWVVATSNNLSLKKKKIYLALWIVHNNHNNHNKTSNLNKDLTSYNKPISHNNSSRNSNKILKEEVSILWIKLTNNQNNHNNHNNLNSLNSLNKIKEIKEVLISWITTNNHNHKTITITREISILCNKNNKTKDKITWITLTDNNNNQIWWTSMEINNNNLRIKITDIRCSNKTNKWDFSNSHKWIKWDNHKWTNKASSNNQWTWDKVLTKGLDSNQCRTKECSSKTNKILRVTDLKTIIWSTKIELNLIKRKNWIKCLILWIFDLSNLITKLVFMINNSNQKLLEILKL